MTSPELEAAQGEAQSAREIEQRRMAALLHFYRGAVTYADYQGLTLDELAGLERYMLEVLERRGK